MSRFARWLWMVLVFLACPAFAHADPITMFISFVGFGLAGGGIAGVSTAAILGSAIGTGLLATGVTYGLGAITGGFSKLLAPSSPKPSITQQGSQTSVRQPIAYRRVIYGTQRLGGIITYASISGTTKNELNFVITLAGHEVNAITSMYFDNKAQGAPGWCGGTVGNKWYWHVKRGAPGEAAHALAANGDAAWTANHRQDGCASVWTRLMYDQNFYPNGVPSLTFDIQGKKVYDPRGVPGNSAFSDNPALCVLDYLTNTDYGYGVSMAKIDLPSFIAAANICEEPITSAIEHDSDMPAGTIRRYRCNGSFTTDTEPGDILSGLLSSMGGSLIKVNGKWSVYPAAWRSPGLVLTDADFRGKLQVTARRSRRDLFNSIKGTYVSPANNWQPSDFPAVSNAAYVTEDGGQAIWKDVQLPFTTSCATAQRLAKIELERNRRQLSATLPCKLAAYQAQACDTIQITHDRFGWAAKSFEVVTAGLGIEQNSDAPVLGVDLSVRETDANVYNWNYLTDEQTPAATDAVDLDTPQVVGNPSDLILTCGAATAQIRQDGVAHARVKCVWIQPPDARVVSGGHIDVETSADGATWEPCTTVDGNQSVYYIVGLTEGKSYYVRIRARNVFNSTSAWLQSTDPILVTSSGNSSAGSGAGKNMLSNPGFESNNVGTLLNSWLTAVPQSFTDGWIFSSNPNTWYVADVSSNSRSGGWAAAFFMGNNVSVPNGNSVVYAAITTTGSLPANTGDIARISGWIAPGGPALPAGVIIWCALSINFLNSAGAWIGAVQAWAPSNPSGWTFIDQAQAIPAQSGGQNIAALNVSVIYGIANSSGSTFNTGINQFYGCRFIDDLRVVLQSTAYDLTPLNTAYVSTGTGPVLHQSGSTGTVLVDAFTLQFGDGQINYNGGSIATGLTPTASPGTPTVIYFDDPTYSGGSVTFHHTENGSTVAANNGRIILGKCFLKSTGGGSGDNGGGDISGSFHCFSPNTRVRTKRGPVAFSDLQLSDEVLTLKGWRHIREITCNPYDGLLYDMGNDELVTPGHQFCRGAWLHARDLFSKTVQYVGNVMNLHVETEIEEERNYQLANGETVHNLSIA